MAAVAAFACAASVLAADTGFVDRSVTVGGVTYRHQVYVPADHSAARAWPVVLFLHGHGESGDDGMLPTDHGIGTAIRRHRDRFPAVVVFPQCRRGSVWFGAMEAQALAALDQAIREFNGDRERVYVAGTSLGAFGSYQLAARNPGRFAAIVAVAGGIVPPPGFPMPAEVVAAEKAGDPYLVSLRTADPYARVANRIGPTAAWIVHGETDPVVPASEARRMAEALRQAGSDVRYTEYAGEGHGITERAYADPALPAWLFAHRLRR